MTTPAEVLGFWFGAPLLAPRSEWFAKSDTFDALVRERFGAAVEAALGGSLGPAWAAQPLAEILLLDQFTRNIHRGTARAFAGDTRALALARGLVASGADQLLQPLERVFAYLPFEHAESMPMQDEAVRLFGALAATDAAQAEVLRYAQRHREVIERFGRFPHRNLVLGRLSTADEAAYLALPGSEF
jgi:uncharacterized protein (DUF924 family)